MAVNQLKIKRSAVTGRIPTTSSLALGELALNTYDGKLYFKQDRNGSESIVELATTSGSLVTSASYALTASYVPGLSLFSISTGSVTASVSTNPNNLFLINSGSNNYLNISASSNATLSSNLFIIQNFTTQQPVLIVSESVVQIVTHSVAPTGSTTAGSFWFTTDDLFIGLD